MNRYLNSLKKKFLFGAILILMILNLPFILYSFYQMNWISTNTDSRKKITEIFLQLRDTENKIGELIMSSGSFYKTNDPDEEKNDWEHKAAALKTNFEFIQQNIGQLEQYNDQKQVAQVVDNYRFLLERFEKLQNLKNVEEPEVWDQLFSNQVLLFLKHSEPQKERTLKNLNDRLAQLEQNIDRGQLIFHLLLALSFFSLTALILLVLWKLYHITYQSLNRVSEPISILSKGNLPANVSEDTDLEFQVVHQELNRLTGNLQNVKLFASEVGSGHFDNEMSIFDNKGEIGTALMEMKESLKQVAQQEKERNWSNEGFAKFGDLLRKYADDLNILADHLITDLVRYLDANQGGIFIYLEENQEEPQLQLAACYAYERKKFIEKTIKPGQGLVGQCFLEKETIYLLDVPEDYVHIRSGLGKATPGNILIVPLKLNSKVFGVMEIASFQPIPNHKVAFVEQLAESIASTISSVKINETTRNLLHESQIATEQLRAQEEEMRQNMEELAATQEEMHRNQSILLEKERKTRLLLENSYEGIITLDNNLSIDLFNQAAVEMFGYNAEEVLGMELKLFFPETFHEQLENLLSGNASSLMKNSEVKAKRRSGEEFPISFKIEKGNLEGKEIRMIFVQEVREIIRDKTVEAASNDSKDFSNLPDYISEFVFKMDSQLKLQYFNQKASEFFRNRKMKVELGSAFEQLFSELQMQNWAPKFDQARNGEKIQFTDEAFQWEVSVHPEPDHGFFVVASENRPNIDSEVNIELELAELESLKKQLQAQEELMKTYDPEVLSDNRLEQLMEKQATEREWLKMKLLENESKMRLVIQQKENGKGKKKKR